MEFNRKLDSWITWIALSNIGKNKTVKSFNLWFILIPILVKLFENVNDTVKLQFISSEPIVLTMQLPFSLTLLYISSIFFAISNTIFSLRCPSLIRNYDKYANFDISEGSEIFLKQYFEDFLGTLNSADNLKEKYSFVSTIYQGTERSHSATSDIDKFLRNTPIPKDNLRDAYAFVRIRLNRIRYVERIFCASFYLLGFTIIAWIIGENIKYVLFSN